jgi:nucleoside-diphosphate kinase
MQQTLIIIKPDAVAKKFSGAILSTLESSLDIQLVAVKMLHLTKEQAKEFYYVHQGKDFYNGLTDFMSSGSIVVCVFAGEDIINKTRKIMGVTDSTKAAPGTIRQKFGTDTRRNAIHGSDSLESAAVEIKFFFKKEEICL